MSLLGELQSLYRYDQHGRALATRVQNLLEGMAALYKNFNASSAEQQARLRSMGWWATLDALRLRWETWQSAVLIPALQEITSAPMTVSIVLSRLKAQEPKLIDMQVRMGGLETAQRPVTGREIGAAIPKQPDFECDFICWGKIAAVGFGVYYVGKQFGLWSKLLGATEQRYRRPPGYARS